MAEAATPNQEQRQFLIQRVFLKDLSLETPSSPDIFRSEWKPETKMELQTDTKKLDDHSYEVTLKVTVTTKVEDKTAYLVEAQQAGIFSFRGFSEQELAPMLGAYCPNTLFPFIREVIANLISKASFPPLLLQPVNFDAIYAQRLRELAAQQQAATEAAPDAGA